MTIRHARVLLDTSVVIDPPGAGVGRIADQVALSAITVAELQYGLAAGRDPVEQLHRRRRLQFVIDAYDVLPFDEGAAEFYGLLAELVRSAGRNPSPRRMDLLIAATAVRHQLPLATRNASDLVHLERVLTVVDLS